MDCCLYGPLPVCQYGLLPHAANFRSIKIGCCLMWPTSGLSIWAADSCGQPQICQYGLLPLWPTSGLSIRTAVPHMAHFRFVHMGCCLTWPTRNLSIWTAASCDQLPVCQYGLLPHVANFRFVNMRCCLMWPTSGLSQLCTPCPQVVTDKSAEIVRAISTPAPALLCPHKLSSLPNQISGRSSLKEKIKPTRWDMKYSCHVTKVRDSWQDILQKQWKMGLPKPSCHHVIEY